VDVTREIDYYAKQSTRMTRLITIPRRLVAESWRWRRVWCAEHHLFAVSERSREIATLRALGFGGPASSVHLVVEALLISFLGGVLDAFPCFG